MEWLGGVMADFVGVDVGVNRADGLGGDEGPKLY